MAILALYARFFHPAGDRGLNQRVKWGIAILAVAGLNILPSLGYDILYALQKLGPVYESVEWWNNPLTSFLDNALWDCP